MRLPYKPKPDSCTDAVDVNAAGGRGERCGSYPGRPHGRERSAKEPADPERGNGDGPPVATANREESAEAIVPAAARGEGPNPDGGSH